jgi:hypothetical protein
MNLSLAEALEKMEPGKTYRCRFKGALIELRMVGAIPPDYLPAPLVESDIMLDAWVELPYPTFGTRVHCKPGKLPLPDVPEIPMDEETP